MIPNVVVRYQDKTIRMLAQNHDRIPVYITHHPSLVYTTVYKAGPCGEDFVAEMTWSEAVSIGESSPFMFCNADGIAARGDAIQTPAPEKWLG